MSQVNLGSNASAAVAGTSTPTDMTLIARSAPSSAAQRPPGATPKAQQRLQAPPVDQGDVGLRDNNGGTLATPLKARQVLRGSQWRNDGVVAERMRAYSATAPKRNAKPEPTGPDGSVYLRAEHGKMRLIAANNGRVITDLPQARARSSDVMRHGGLTMTTEAQAQTADKANQERQEALRGVIYNNDGNQRRTTLTQTTPVMPWDGNASQPPSRQDARGNFGVEFKVGKEVRFLRVAPYLRETLQGAGMAKAENFRVSPAPAINSDVFARDVLLHTNDPNVIESLQDGAEPAEKTGDVVSTATEVVGKVSPLASVAGTVGVVAKLATVAKVVSTLAPAAKVGLLAALLAAPAFFLLPHDQVTDGTLTGQYDNDARRSAQNLQTIDFLLKRESPLFPAERSRLNEAVRDFTATARAYSTTEQAPAWVATHIPKNRQFPFAQKAILDVENAVRKKHPDFQFYQTK